MLLLYDYMLRTERKIDRGKGFFKYEKIRTKLQRNKIAYLSEGSTHPK